MKNFNYATRLNSFSARPDLYDWKYEVGNIKDLIDRAEEVEDLDKIALNYPQHIKTKEDLYWIKNRLKSSKLKIEALNSRFNTKEFFLGALTNPNKKIREKAIDLCKEAIDSCRELGGDHFILWLSEDGFDYPFQVDLQQVWEYEIEGIRKIAEYGNDLKVSIEYKPFEPRKVSLLANLGTTIMAIDACDCANLGITIDYCHLLMGNEYPSLSMMLANSIDKLFGVHLNDGYGQADDGLMVGSVTTVQTMEFLYYLIKTNYKGVIYFDTFPIREDPVKESQANIIWTEMVSKKLKEFSPQIEKAQFEHNSISMQKIMSLLINSNN